MPRSRAYWATNLYSDPGLEPEASAPLRDLPRPAAGRFRSARQGLLRIPGVTEGVRFMGSSWRWAWEYAVGNRKLCWLHPMREGPSTTFTVSDAEEARLRAGPRLAQTITRAVAEGQRTGPLRWCWLELSDQRTVSAFLTLARRKAAWLGERPPAARTSRPRGRRLLEQDAEDGRVVE